jgi:sugar lactone lactonase YvrE
LAGGRGQGLSREQLNNPTSVVLTTNRDLIICDSDNKRIQRWNHNTNYGETLIDGVACRQIFVNESGDLLFTTAKNEIFKCLPTENRTELVIKAGGKNPPKGESNMFLSRTGNLYVADAGNNRILKYAAGAVDADVIAGGQTWESSELNHLIEPQSVIVDDKETLYIADSGNDRIIRWAAGDTIGVVVAKVTGVKTVRFDQDGNMYGLTGSSVTRFNINKSACGKFF